MNVAGKVPDEESELCRQYNTNNAEYGFSTIFGTYPGNIKFNQTSRLHAIIVLSQNLPVIECTDLSAGSDHGVQAINMPSQETTAKFHSHLLFRSPSSCCTYCLSKQPHLFNSF